MNEYKIPYNNIEDYFLDRTLFPLLPYICLKSVNKNVNKIMKRNLRSEKEKTAKCDECKVNNSIHTTTHTHTLSLAHTHTPIFHTETH